MSLTHLFLAILLAINLFSFFIIANDKRKSTHRHDADRTPEGILFFLAAAGGSLGVYLAMQLFRHKTRKWYFQIGIPLLILQNSATVYVIWQFLAVN
jgi:uncharacterized membrane protein YsdA (DUF1294 family)